MTFNPNADIRSSNVTRGGGGGGFPGGGGRRGGGVAIGGGAGGCLLVVLLIGYTILGGNPLDLLGGGDTGGGAPVVHGGALQECQTGAAANNRDDCLVQATIESDDSLWAKLAPANGIRFTEPNGVVFSGQTNTGCGPATSATGPFYCPADATIYIDTSFYQELQSRFGSDGGQLAKMYVVAHEYGHHIQNLDGTLSRANHNDTGPQGEMVRLELQADCYAGVWAHHASSTTDAEGRPMLEPLTREDVASALSAAAAVGDDHIQRDVSGGRVRPDTWTHGSSQQRESWFTRGLDKGTMQACDTFAAPEV